MNQKSTTFQKSTLRKKTIHKQNIEIEKTDEYNFIHSYGEIHFPGCEEPVKYVRTDQRNTQDQWKRILTEKWNLKPPTLIISILSSHAELTKRFKNTLKKGLWKAAEGSGCWIITDGFDHGMTKVAGEAVRDYTEAYGNDHMIMVGVAHTERVTYQELFDLADHNVRSKDISSNVLYPDPLSDEETDDITNTATTSMEADLWQFNESGQQIDSSVIKLSNKSLTKTKTYRLNSNHQFLILTDPILKQEQTLEDRLLETRIMLERTIITWAKPSSRSTCEGSGSAKTSSQSILSKNKKLRKKEQKFKGTEESFLPIITVTPRPSATLPSLADGLIGQTIRRQSHLYTRSQIEKNTGVKDLFQKNELNENQSVDKEINILQNISQDELNSTSQTTARVPICGIVGGGNTATLDQIYASVTLNRCPMVLVRGTGGVADILSNVLDFMSFRNTLEETFTDQEIDYKIASIIQEVYDDARSNKRGRTLKKSDKSTKYTEKSTNVTINLPTDNSGKPSTNRTEQNTNTMINIKEYESQVYRIKELADDYAHLFSIFEYDDIDLDGYMISALLSSAGIDRPKNELNLDQLEITIRLNRADIARTKIFLEGKRWKKGDLNEFMFNVILNEQTDFVRLILENGFNLDDFLTVHTLERLYTECLKKTDYKSRLLQQLWKSSRIYKMDWVMLRDIGRIIKNLLGDFYHPFYLSKRFQHSVVEHGYCESSDEEATNDNLYDEYEKQPGKTITSTSTLKAVEPIPISFNIDEKSDAEKSDDHNIDHEENIVQSEQISQFNQQSKRSQKNDQSKRNFNQQHTNKKIEDTEDVTSYTSSNNSSETKLIKSSQHRTKSRRSISAGTRRNINDAKSNRSKQSVMNNNNQISSLMNRRQYIVKPIVGTNNIRNYYQNDYYSYSDSYENDHNGKMNDTTMGKKRLITTLQHANETDNYVPKAQEDSFPDRSFSIINEKSRLNNSNGLISSDQENAAVNIIVQSHSSIHSSKTEVSVITDPNIIDDQPSDHLHYQQQHQNVTRSHDQSISSICQTTTLSKQTSSNRNNKFPVQRVAHSILHPLTDPEKARLRLREIERQTLERKREKERKRRHRIAQEKFTIMERLTGQAKAERLEELKPSKLANFRHTSTVKFDRPARELMMMCILLGRFEMAEIFWNQEKEPIAAALVLSILIAELGQKSDDVANKEEYEENARSFEDKADQVLEECYQEDRARTLILLYRKLEFYGNTSVIRLAARGKCIRFMANPCCQDLLSGVWSGRLSPKNTWIQLVPAIIMGISIPFIIPQFIKYSTSIESGNSPIGQTKIDQDENKSRSEVEKLVKLQRQSIHLDKPITLGTRISSQIERIQIFYQAPIIRFVYNTIFYLLFLIVFSKTLLTSLTLSFSYLDIFTTLMVGSFLCEELKQAFSPGSSLKEYISDGWNKLDCLAISLYIIGLSVKIHAYYNLINEQIYQLNNHNNHLLIHFNNSIQSQLLHNQTNINNYYYIDQYNLINNSFNLSIEQIQLMKSIKTIKNLQIFSGYGYTLNQWTPDLPYYIISNELFTISRIFFAFSLFAFYVRLMYIFSFSIVLGPKLIMINRMVVHDLLPFLLILLVCQIGYGIAFQSISFANGYYSDYEQEKMTVNSTYQSKPGIRSLYDVIMTSYFQMLGEFRLDDLAGDGSSCRDNGMCPQTSSRRLTIIMLSAFILLTQVLMFNLLVATFTSTYNEIEGSAQYFWCYQRYEMIQEFVDRPSVAAPFMLLWYSVEFTGFLFSLIGGTLFNHAIEEIKDDDPFCRSLHTNSTLDSKLTKWEHMMGTRRIKADTDVGGGRKWTGRSHGDTHAIVLRSAAAGAAGKGLVSGGTSVHRDVTGEPGSLLEGIGPIFGPDTEFIEEKFRELGNQIGKLSTFEERLGKLIQGGNRVTSIVKKINEQQKQIIKSLTPTNGKRLVGWGKSNKKENKNLLMTAVCAAVTGLDSHCTIIEEKIEEKLRIEEQCVKAILTRSNGDELEADTVLTPRKGPPSRGPRAAPASGKIYERLILSHRLWRIVPFNFEIFPGIRMNVPHDKINWKIPYDTYRTFTVTDDRIALPYPELEDGPEVSPQTLPYNSYDIVKGVSRMSLRGRVRIVRQTDHITDPRTTNVTSKTAPTKSTAKLSEYIPVGYPLNPCGRTGLSGKGLLPHWGPNHCIIIAITRPDPGHRFYENLPFIQVGLLHNNQQLCLPWYLTDHREDCDFQDCSANVIRGFIQRRLMNLFENKHHQQSMLISLRAASVSIAYTGYITDHLNADHAWIEGVLFNIHENEEHPFQQEFLQVFLESETTEQALWVNIGRLTGIRSSHDELLARIALHRGAFYSEALAKRQLQPTY